MRAPWKLIAWLLSLCRQVGRKLASYLSRKSPLLIPPDMPYTQTSEPQPAPAPPSLLENPPVDHVSESRVSLTPETPGISPVVSPPPKRSPTTPTPGLSQESKPVAEVDTPHPAESVKPLGALRGKPREFRLRRCDRWVNLLAKRGGDNESSGSNLHGSNLG